MTEKEYEIYDELIFDTDDNTLLIYARQGREFTEWELDALEGVFYHRKV